MWGNSERKGEFWEKASEDILRKGGREGILSDRGCERNIREGKWEGILKEGKWKGILSKGIVVVVKSLSYVPHFFVSRLLCLRDFPARILEWVTISFFRASPLSRDQTWIPCIKCRQIPYLWSTREAQVKEGVRDFWEKEGEEILRKGGSRE